MQTILIAGGTGLIGNRLSYLLTQKGYTILHLSRRKNLEATYPAYQWDLEKQEMDEEALLRADYVINLAGAGIADKRWSVARKQLIIDSRTKGNALLQKYFLKTKKPKAYISSAAIGYYGDRATAVVKETSPPNEKGFLAESCVLWEQSIQDLLTTTKVRTVILRVGLVLSTLGGALEKILISFNFRTGAYFGDGSMIYSWIHIDDMCAMFIKAIEDEQMEGIYNGVAPNPVSNKELTYKIAEALDKKVLIVPAPSIGLRLAMGEMADAVLTSAHVSSEKIEAAGFQFQYPTILPALQDLLSRKI